MFLFSNKLIYSGGLLFPWHIGALTALSHHQFLTDKNPIAGSSAGSIAVASHAAKVSAESALEATVRISDECQTLGQARGNLLPLLEMELNSLLDEDVHETFNSREGYVGLAYRELFPMNRPVLDTYFDSKEHVIDSICNSSMFPFFSTNFPCRFARRNGGILPRITVDGYFSVDRSRFGCPCFNTMEHRRKVKDSIDGDEEEESNVLEIERTVSLSVFPHGVVKVDAFDQYDQISPMVENPDDLSDQISRLFRLATECGTKEDYHELYESGWKDVERWIGEEERRGYWGLNSSERRKIYGNELKDQN